MASLKNISGCVLFFAKMLRLFGKGQGSTSTADLHHEYSKNIFECSHKPQNYQQHVVNIVNADFQVLSEFKVPVT